MHLCNTLADHLLQLLEIAYNGSFLCIPDSKIEALVHSLMSVTSDPEPLQTRGREFARRDGEQVGSDIAAPQELMPSRLLASPPYTNGVGNHQLNCSLHGVIQGE